MGRSGTKLLEREGTETRTYFDFSLLMLVFIISMIGLVFIYSSSYYIAQAKNLSPLHFVKRQMVSLAVGSGAMFFAILVPYRFYLMRFPGLKIRPSHILLLLAYVLQLYVMFFVKEDRNGSYRWINLGSFGTVQPSEISKLAIILYTSMVCYRAPERMSKFFKGLKSTFPVIPLIVLIGVENLSSAIIAAVIYFGIWFVTSRKYSHFIILFLLGIGSIWLFSIYGEGYRFERFRIWKNIENEPKGFQILQGLYAIASGGFFGSGLGEGAGKFNKIPEAYNDMIFTIICEEIGLFGAFAVLSLYLFLIARLYMIAMNSLDLFAGLITVGVMIEIGVQTLLNVAVVTNMIPSTGITLPFISYGGSSVIFLLIGIGIVLNISKKIKYYV